MYLIHTISTPFVTLLQFVELVVEIGKLLARKFVEITSNKDFLLLRKKDPSSLVSRSDLQVKCEDHVFSTDTRWINHHYNSRSKYLFDLLQLLKLDLIVSELLADIIC